MRLVPEVSSAVASIETGVPRFVRECPHHAAIGFTAHHKGSVGQGHHLAAHDLQIEFQNTGHFAGEAFQSDWNQLVAGFAHDLKIASAGNRPGVQLIN